MIDFRRQILKSKVDVRVKPTCCFIIGCASQVNSLVQHGNYTVKLILYQYDAQKFIYYYVKHYLKQGRHMDFIQGIYIGLHTILFIP